MKIRKCSTCGRMRWVKTSSSEMSSPARVPVCLPCRRRAGGADPSQLVGASHPKRIKKTRAPKPKDAKKEKAAAKRLTRWGGAR